MRPRFHGGNHIPPGLPAETETMQRRIEMPNKPPPSLPSNQLFKFIAFFLFLFFFFLPLRSWAGSLFFKGALRKGGGGRETSLAPGVSLGSVFGFVGRLQGGRGGERWRRPKKPLRSPAPSRPPRPGCPCSEGTPGGKRRSQSRPPSARPFPALQPALQPSRRGFSTAPRQKVAYF